PAIRPQLGSRPWTAAFTSDDETTARATARASASPAPPRAPRPQQSGRAGASGRPQALGGAERGPAPAVGRLLAGELPRHGLDRVTQLPRLAGSGLERQFGGRARREGANPSVLASVVVVC